MTGETQILTERGDCVRIMDLYAGAHIVAYDGTSFVPDIVLAVTRTGITQTYNILSKQFPKTTCSAHQGFITTQGIIAKAPDVDGQELLQYTGMEGTVNDHGLATDLAVTFSDGAKSYSSRVRLPQRVWSLTKDSVLKYLSKVISREGNIHINNRYWKGSVTIKCYRSSHLAWDLYWLMRKIGLIPQPPKPFSTSWHVTCGRQTDVSELLTYPILGRERERQLKIINNLVYTPTDKHDNFYIAPVTSARDEFREIYTLTTARNLHVIANGYVLGVH